MADELRPLLSWLIAAGVQVTIGTVDHQDGAHLRVALDVAERVTWYGDLDSCLADARIYCERVGITP